MIRFLIGLFAAVTLSNVSNAQAPQPPLEAYGELEQVSWMAISPNGEFLTFITRGEGKNLLTVMNLTNRENFAAEIGDLKVTGLDWLGNDHVILDVFRAERMDQCVGGKIDFEGAFAFNIKTKKIRQLLIGTEGLFPCQGSMGNIVGLYKNGKEALMPAYNEDRDLMLYRVDLKSGKGRVVRRGRRDTFDWIVEDDAKIIAQSRYDNGDNMFRVRSEMSGEMETVVEFESDRRPGISGITADKSALVVLTGDRDGFDSLRTLSFKGDYSAPIMKKDKTEITGVLRDNDRIVYGVRYGGLLPSYEFFDPELTQIFDTLQQRAPNVAISIQSWSDGFNKIIIRMEGSGFAGDFFLIDRATGGMQFISSSRPHIPPEAVAAVTTISYKARDGLEIPAIITTPPGVQPENLPTIVMPHGGPESHDVVAFDFIAQYFANRGYIVLQPNFRGSDGFGKAFTDAGYGGWGGVMQDDVSDGLQFLVDQGLSDPSKVCIVGWSYGGYSALAGGAFSPELYNCIVSINGVSHLQRMLNQEKRDFGNDHWVVSYWEKAMAKGDATQDTLKEKSPAEFAENFQAPVLLIAGNDDSIVNKNQSEFMRDRLKAAGKPVTYVNMSGEGHSMLTPGARLRVLQELDKFVSANISN